MIQTTIRELKDGQFFTFRPHEYPKERQVYVRSRYDRSGKKFAYFPYSDMMDEHFAKGSRVVFTDFIFWNMKTLFGDTMLPNDKRKLFIDKLETMSTREVLSILYQYYGNRNLLSEECYNLAVENGFIDKLW